jgi:DNA-binding winged helix-turn-helix (wHTH) protein/TolB-like protein
MYESTEDDMSTPGIDLAREPDFDLGALRVHPAKCEVGWEGAAQVLQRRVMQVLVVLAHARGSVVSQDMLVRRCWRGLSVSDDAIFRCISKLRKLAAGYPDAPFEIETIPGVGYRLTVEDDRAAETAAPKRRRSRLRALGVIAALAILALVGSIIWIGRGNTPAHSIRVTVQPFEALSNSGDIRLLARRIPNEVVDALGDSQIEAALGGQQAGKAAQPGLIVTGIVRDESGNTNVDVRIEDSATHAALWSTEFKRDSRQASDLPLEVAARVTDMVNMVAFARSADPPLTDNSTLSGVLQTTDMIRDGRDELWAQVIQHAQDIVARHPEFAFGHSLLAAAYGDASEVVPDRAQAMRDAARLEANLTLKLDPQDAGAYLVLSQLETPYDYRAQEALLLRGIKFGKHPKEPLGALYQYENGLLDNVGRLQEGLSYQMVAQATDQWSPSKTSRQAFVYANMGNLAAAKAWIQKAMERWPNHSSALAYQRYIAGFYEEPSEALAVFDQLDAQGAPGNDQNTIWRTFIQAKAAHSEQVTATAIERIRAAADQGKIPREIEIMMIAGLGDAKQAIEAANLGLDHQNLEPRLFLFAPITRNMRQDPGFLPLASRLGLIQYWRQTGKWPDFCTDQGRRAECSPELRAAMNSRV